MSNQPDYREERAELGGWPVRIVSYQGGEQWFCTIDNIDPGATIARAAGESREAAIEAARAKAGERLGRTRVNA